MKYKEYNFLLAILIFLVATACTSTPKQTQSNDLKQSTKPELIYIYDPLCGWCYGFSPVMQKLKENYKDKFNFIILSGGLAISDNPKSIKEGFSFIKNALQEVTDETGVEFGKPFLELADEGSYIYNSEPPCVALTVFKSIKPERAFAFSHDMQLSFFKEGKSLNDSATYLELVKKFDVNPDEFLKKFREDEYKKKTYQEFETAEKLDANGFPTIIIRNAEQTKVISNGYQDYETVSKLIEKEIK
jgi:putative protein-disulfide isomerase